MEISEQEFAAANRRANARRALGRYAVAARVSAGTLIVDFASGAQVRVPVRLIEGLAEAPSRALRNIELSPAGLGVHFPDLDADVHVAALMKGVFGSAGWMRTVAGELAAAGGRKSSPAKAAAARANGRKGGRPRLVAS